jgi:hypothetical protein
MDASVLDFWLQLQYYEASFLVDKRYEISNLNQIRDTVA